MSRTAKLNEAIKRVEEQFKSALAKDTTIVFVKGVATTVARQARLKALQECVRTFAEQPTVLTRNEWVLAMVERAEGSQ